MINLLDHGYLELVESWGSDERIIESARMSTGKGFLGWGPKELARLPVPVGRYSRMRATSNLRGWFAFLKLRGASDAQYEIRVYAHAIASVLAERFPRTMEIVSG